MSDWKEFKLGEVYDFASGLSKSRKEFGFGYDFVSFKDVFKNYFIPKQLTELANTSEKERQTFSVKRGDVFLTRTSETQEELGMSSVALKDYTNATFNGFTKRLRPKLDIDIEISPEYAGFYFRSPRFRATITNMASITTRASLNNDMLSSLTIILPPINEQIAIASVLSSLDDKIDLLHRQNNTMEAMAESLFRQLFIEEAQDNWEEKPLGELVTVKRGGSPRPIQEYISETGLNWLKISDATKTASPFIFEINERIKEEGLKKTVLLKKGNLVLSNSATPGIPKILQVDSCIHDGWLHFPKSHFSNEFLYLLFKKIRPELLIQGNGSIFTNLKTDILKEYTIPIPDNDSLIFFDNQIKPTFNKMLENSKQIRTLEKLRDTLLPKLMSGEIRVEI